MPGKELIYKDDVLDKLDALAAEPDYQHPGEDWGVGVCMANTIVYEEEPVSLKIERVSSDNGDWHGFYVNGTLIHEGMIFHCIKLSTELAALSHWTIPKHGFRTGLQKPAFRPLENIHLNKEAL